MDIYKISSGNKYASYAAFYRKRIKKGHNIFNDSYKSNIR